MSPPRPAGEVGTAGPRVGEGTFKQCLTGRPSATSSRSWTATSNLNPAPWAPSPAGRAALERYANDWDSLGTPGWFFEWDSASGALRMRVGSLLNAPAGSTAIAPSVSSPSPPSPQDFSSRGRNKVLVGDSISPRSATSGCRPEFEVEFVASADGMTIRRRPRRADRQPDAMVVTTHLLYTTGYLQAPGDRRRGARCRPPCA